MVIGGGTMGRGIAQVFLQGHIPVTLVEINEAVLSQAKADIKKRLERLEEKGKLEQGAAEQMFSKLTCSAQVEHHEVDLIIEAIIENMEIKKKLFQQIDQTYAHDTIIASNTSSFSITELASAVSHPERVVGMHFFNPAPLMPLVEVISGLDSHPTLIEELLDLLKGLGKSPVKVKDTPGFIVNRVARPYYNEALKMLGEQMADVEEIDAILEDAGFPMGPFKLQDLIGIDINFATTASLYQAYHQEPRFRPHYIQERMVKSNRLGRKTGRGFYSYE